MVFYNNQRITNSLGGITIDERNQPANSPNPSVPVSQKRRDVTDMARSLPAASIADVTILNMRCKRRIQCLDWFEIELLDSLEEQFAIPEQHRDEIQDQLIDDIGDECLSDRGRISHDSVMRSASVTLGSAICQG